MSSPGEALFGWVLLFGALLVVIRSIRRKDPEEEVEVFYNNPRKNHDYDKRYARDLNVHYSHDLLQYSNPHKNHDHNKRMYLTREDAEAVVERMKKSKCDGYECMNVYYSRELGGWFVGRSNRREGMWR